MKISEFFTDNELTCRCGCGLLPPESSVRRLYALRLILGKAMVITSAARCLVHNANVGGAIGSTHLPALYRDGESSKWGGCGFDIRASNLQEAMDIMCIAQRCGFRGFGLAKTFVHIDDAARPQLTYWDY